MEDKVEKNTQSESQTKKRPKKNENSLRELWDNMKQTNIFIIGMPEGDENKQEIEKCLKK